MCEWPGDGGETGEIREAGEEYVLRVRGRVVNARWVVKREFRVEGRGLVFGGGGG